jgi:hypothetical protein
MDGWHQNSSPGLFHVFSFLWTPNNNSYWAFSQSWAYLFTPTISHLPNFSLIHPSFQYPQLLHYTRPIPPLIYRGYCLVSHLLTPYSFPSNLSLGAGLILTMQIWIKNFSSKAGQVAQVAELLHSKHASMRPWVQTPVPKKKPNLPSKLGHNGAHL